MLKNLSQKQEALIPVIRKKWIDLAFTPKEYNREKLVEGYQWLYGLCNLKKPFVVVMRSPMEVQLAANMVGGTKEVERQVRDQVEGQVWDQVRDQVRDQVADQVWDQVRVQVRVEPKCFGAFESQSTSEYWVSFYDFFSEIGIVKLDAFNRYRNLMLENPWYVVLLDSFVFISKPPCKEVKRRPDGVVHNPTGPAYEWENGERYYVLNGVNVPEWVVEKQAHAITRDDILKEENAEVRRELIRRIGVETYIQRIGAKVINKKGDYELLDVRLSDETPHARYLKMKNPSINTWHVEGVEGNTVDEAIDWRAGKNWAPAVMT